MLGNLVANLIADTKGWSGPLQRAEGQFGSFLGGIQKGMGALGGMLSGFAAPLAAALGLGASVQSFRESEQAGKKLDAVLRSTGGSAGLTGEEIRKLAGDLQRVTNFEDDATIGAAGVLATFTKIRGDVFKSALIAAQDLSSVMGQDLQSSVVQVGKALNDPIKGITALSRVGVSFTEQQKAQIKAMEAAGNTAGAQALILKELQTEFGGAAQAMADPLTILGNMIGDIGEGIGSAIVPALNEIASAITSSIVPAGQSMQEVFTNVGTVLADWVRAGIDFVHDGIQTVGFAVENWGSIVDLVFTQSQLKAVEFTESLKHFFTSVVPSLLSWFGDNWQEVFFTAFDLATTVFINLGQNIRNAMQEIWDFISSGGQDALELFWQPLTEGFKNTIKELPDIPQRAITELEQQLAADADRIGSDLGQRLGEQLADGVGEAAKKPEFTAPVLTGNAEGENAAGGGRESRGPGAALQGSREALSSIFSAMRGKDSEIQKRIERIQQQQLAQQTKQTEHLSQIAKNPPVLLASEAI